jgi:hypothetical protein
MGCEVECALLVRGGERASGPIRCTVLHAPDWLDDGYYEAIFGGQSAFLHLGHGAWSIGIAWARIPSRKKADPIAEPFIAEWTRSLAG